MSANTSMCSGLSSKMVRWLSTVLCHHGSLPCFRDAEQQFRMCSNVPIYNGKEFDVMVLNSKLFEMLLITDILLDGIVLNRMYLDGISFIQLDQM